MNTLLSITFAITCFAAIQWGLIGLGGFLGKNLNIISFITRGNFLIEYIIYGLMGLSGVCYIWIIARK